MSTIIELAEARRAESTAYIALERAQEAFDRAVVRLNNALEAIKVCEECQYSPEWETGDLEKPRSVNEALVGDITTEINGEHVPVRLCTECHERLA